MKLCGELNEWTFDESYRLLTTVVHYLYSQYCYIAFSPSFEAAYVLARPIIEEGRPIPINYKLLIGNAFYLIFLPESLFLIVELVQAVRSAHQTKLHTS